MLENPLTGGPPSRGSVEACRASTPPYVRWLIRPHTLIWTRVGLTTLELIRDGQVHRIRGSHPVYEKGYKGHVKHIRDFIASIEGLLTIGRHGTVSFNSISDS